MLYVISHSLVKGMVPDFCAFLRTPSQWAITSSYVSLALVGLRLYKVYNLSPIGTEKGLEVGY